MKAVGDATASSGKARHCQNPALPVPASAAGRRMAVKTTIDHPAIIWSRRQESNLDLSLRRAEFYPLKYSESANTTGAHCIARMHQTALYIMQRFSLFDLFFSTGYEQFF
jgi:hypothetical protein